MKESLQQTIERFDPDLGLERASTPPASWYRDESIAALEAEAVFAGSWQLVARRDQLQSSGAFVTAELAGEPIVVVRDGEEIRGFYNVCRHHAAQVATDPCGTVRALHCPYHGWTYNLDGTLRNAPQFDGAMAMGGAEFNLQPVRVEQWYDWVFVCLNPTAVPLATQLGDLQLPFDPTALQHDRRVSYELNCNWKVFVDNYLDGGYHVPYLHRELNGALDGNAYRIDVGNRHCIQSCPTSSEASSAGAVRSGTAWYLWLYPNLMVNFYEGLMDLNLVLPAGPERCIVHFDYYFADQDAAFRDESIRVADRVQAEDVAICEAVQRGLRSRSYDTGRLSPLKEGGERRFHQLLHGDLKNALA
ncbi:MAG: aromatic ring-hydroxylating dioxygenase subunit alpha [Pseudomonadota bacterium]